MCPNKDMPACDKGLMDLELFRKIVDEARHFAADMYIHHRGEPLLNPALFEMIACARQAGIKVRFHSNGTVLDEARAAKLLEAGPDLVSFSVDGFEPRSYESIRVGANLDRTAGNIVRLVEMRKARGLKRPYVVVEKIRFRNPATPENPAAVAGVWDRFLAAGVDEVIEKEEYAWATADAPEPPAGRAFSVCTFPWYAMVICADGTVTPCPQDFFAAMKMGNARDAKLLDIWNDRPYRELRRAFRTDVNLLPLCRKCDRLCRKTVAGVPFQYLITFLADQLVGYGKLRRKLGTAERN
jgi:radical SAM protein with 4Fe4S-binding SPASM domain